MYEHGGLTMFDIKSYMCIKGFRSTWIRRLVKDKNSIYKILLENTIYIEKLLNTGSDYTLQMQEFLRNNFWKEIFKAFKEIQDNSNVKSWQDYCCQQLRNINKFEIGNQSIYSSWYVKEVKCVIELFDENGNFLDFEMFK